MLLKWRRCRMCFNHAASEIVDLKDVDVAMTGSCPALPPIQNIVRVVHRFRCSESPKHPRDLTFDLKSITHIFRITFCRQIYNNTGSVICFSRLRTAYVCLRCLSHDTLMVRASWLCSDVWPLSWSSVRTSNDADGTIQTESPCR